MDISKLVNSKELTCFICFKNFTNKASVKRHLSGVHGPKFKCNFCNKRISNSRDNIRQHNRIVHGITRNKFFKLK